MVSDGGGAAGSRPSAGPARPSLGEALDGTHGVALHTAAWYGDDYITLPIPEHWHTTVFMPAVGPELSDDRLRHAVSHPLAQGRLRDIASGAQRPVIVVDDPTRPTPAARVMPILLEELAAAGVHAENVRIVLATGTHGRPAARTVVAKIGREAASQCRIRSHDHRRSAVRMGTTRFGTPVWVDREVADSDLVIGVGGAYPQHTTWFGGGSKLMLGILGERSIASLHYRHWRQSSRYALDSDFRQDLDEVAAIVGLRTSVVLHVDAGRKIVRAIVGDPGAAFADAAPFSRDAFRAPAPGDADVVIANAYPMDTSLTFASSKGTVPLRFARRDASRILVAACSEGGGHHGLFPLVDVPPLHYRVQWLRRQLVQRDELPAKVRHRVRSVARRQVRGGGGATVSAATDGGVSAPIHLFRPGGEAKPMHASIPGIVDSPSWAAAIEAVEAEQRGRDPVRVSVYACAPLQTLDFGDAATEAYEGGE